MKIRGGPGAILAAEHHPCLRGDEKAGGDVPRARVEQYPGVETPGCEIAQVQGRRNAPDVANRRAARLGSTRRYVASPLARG